MTNNAESVKPQIDESREDSTEAISRMEDHTGIGRGEQPIAGCSTFEKARIREKRSSWRPDVGVYGRVGNVLQRDDSDPYVAGSDYSECQGGRLVLQKQIWRFSRWHMLRARHRSGLVSSAGEQPSVATRVAAAQEGPDETMRPALAASSAKEASAASDADVVEKNQMGGEKLVLLIGSPMCQTSRGLITTMMRDADRVSEVKYKNFVEQCVKRKGDVRDTEE